MSVVMISCRFTGWGWAHRVHETRLSVSLSLRHAGTPILANAREVNWALCSFQYKNATAHASRIMFHNELRNLVIFFKTKSKLSSVKSLWSQNKARGYKTHKRITQPLFSLFCRFWDDSDSSNFLFCLASRSLRTATANISSTFFPVLAEASKKSHCHVSVTIMPWSNDVSRSWTSHLFPTSTETKLPSRRALCLMRTVQSWLLLVSLKVSGDPNVYTNITASQSVLIKRRLVSLC